MPLPPHEQWPGTVGPLQATPPRQPGSLRRTTTMDMLRPYGLEEDVVLEGRGRDLLTAPDGSTVVVDQAEVSAQIDYMGERKVQWLITAPADERLQSVVGVRASGGFRKAVDMATPDLAAGGSVLYVLLDEVPVAILIAGASLGINGVRRPEKHRTDRLNFLDVCAGWATNGTMAKKLQSEGMSWSPGPIAPSVNVADDPLAWHESGELYAGCMRRRRRIDIVQPTNPYKPVVVDAHLRDVAVDPDGVELVVHEYSLALEIDTDERVVTSVNIAAHVLPGPECPNAVLSAQRIVGQPVGSLRSYVREHFSGTTTCTHLNDSLRVLGDIATMLKKRPATPPARSPTR